MQTITVTVAVPDGIDRELAFEVVAEAARAAALRLTRKVEATTANPGEMR